MADYRFASFVPATGCTVVPFVGRENEVHQLQRALTIAEQGYVQTVFLTGAAGIGKTRLAEEFTDSARRQNWQIWMGRADAGRDGRSFSSLFQAFRTAVMGLPQLQQSELTDKFPYIHVFSPALGGAAPQQLADGGLERTRLFESLRALAVHLSRERPIVLWIDDLQDADEDTMEWLHYFIRHETRARFVVLATCRTPVRKSATAYHQLYNTLVRYHQLREIEVRPLNLNESVSLVKGVVAGDVEPDVLQLVHTRALGVPLFIIELLRMLTESGDLQLAQGKWDISSGAAQKVPRAIAAVISERLNLLGTQAQQVLNLLAVSDVSLPWGVLQRATGWDDATLTESLSHLIDMAFVAENDSEWDIAYRFTHPMIQETVYARMIGTSIRQVHRWLAEAWENDIVRAAYHIRHSGSMGDVVRSAKLLLAAGQHYLSICAYRSAVEYLEQAMQVAERLPTANATSVVEAIQIALSEAWTYVERAPEALTLLAKLYDSAHAPAAKIRFKRLMVFVEAPRTVEACIQHIEDAIQLWDGTSENEDVLWLLNQYVFSFANTGDIERARTALEALQRYCDAFPSKENVLIKCIREVHLTVCDWGTQSNTIDANALFLEMKGLDNPELAYDAYCLFGYHAVNQGDYGTAVRYRELGVALVRRYGMVVHEISLRMMGMCGDFLAGDWRHALQEADAVERLSRDYSADVAVACVLDFKALIYALQGKSMKAKACTKESMEIVLRVFPDGLASSDALVITPATAVEMFVNGNFNMTTPMSVVWANMHGLPAFLKMLECELQIRQGQLEKAQTRIAQLHHAAQDKVNYFKGVACYLEGVLAHQQGNPDSALDHIGHAIDTFAALETTLECSIARIEWATIAASVHPVEALVQAQRSLDGFRRLGAKPYIDVAEAQIRSIQSAQRTASTDRLTTELSARQHDIIAGVMQGLTNKQIAEHLVVSPRTVSTHLDKIFRKLNVHSRTALIRAINPQD